MDYKEYYIYILSSRKRGVLYIGVTSNLTHRVFHHKQRTDKCFSKKYNVDNLVYFERFIDVTKAIKREKQLKNWKRQWKIDLIEKENPEWKDLFYDTTKTPISQRL